MTEAMTREWDIDPTMEEVLERPSVVIKFNRVAGTAICPICNQTLHLNSGPILVCEGGSEPVCTEHYRSYLDEVVEEYAVLEAARRWYSVSLPPEQPYYTTLREAIYRDPTGFYWPDKSCGLSGDIIMDDYGDDLDMPVVFVGRHLFRAGPRRVEESTPLFRVEDGHDDSLAAILNRDAKRETSWLSLDGRLWTSNQLLQTLTTEQLALSVAWETIDTIQYESIVLWNRREQRPDGDPLLIEVPAGGDALKALELVNGGDSSLPSIRLAERGDTPSWAGIGSSGTRCSGTTD